MKYILSSMLILAGLCSKGQSFLEDPEGDEVVQNTNGVTTSSLFAAINTSEQSLQFQTYYILDKKNIVPLKFLIAGIKAKPSDGIATLFSNGKFNTSTSFNVAYAKKYIFTNRANVTSPVIDFATIRYDMQVNKLTLFRKDTTFAQQINNFNFKGSSVLLNYNLLIKGAHLVTVIIGYAQKNNYSSLDAIDIKDYQSIQDPASGTTREVGKSVSGKQGKYKEFDAFPLRLGYTFCPAETVADKDKLKIGVTLFYSANFGNTKPLTNLGTIIFLTKQSEKTGIRLPQLGIGIQGTDFFDVQDKGTSLSKRISYSLTTAFNLAAL